MKALLLASALALTSAPYEPKISVPVNERLGESLIMFQRVMMAECKKEKIETPECVERYRDTLLSVRKVVDEICEKNVKKEQQVECIQYGISHVLENEVIPTKVKKLNEIEV